MATLSPITYVQPTNSLTQPVAVPANYLAPKNTYDPTQTITGTTAYTPDQTSAISKLNDIITNGGYTPQQISSYTQGAMQPVLQQAALQKTAAANDAYSRGLGNSSVVPYNNTQIDKNTDAQAAAIASQFAAQGAAEVPTAISQVQSGQNAATALQTQTAQIQAQLGMNDEQMQQLTNQLNNAAAQSDADRQITYQNLMNQFGLSSQQLSILAQQANSQQTLSQQNQQSNFISSLLGAGASAAGGIPALIKALGTL